MVYQRLQTFLLSVLTFLNVYFIYGMSGIQRSGAQYLRRCGTVKGKGEYGDTEGNHFGFSSGKRTARSVCLVSK